MKSQLHKNDTFFRRFLTESEIKKYEHMKVRRAEAGEHLKKSLKTHLSTLNDGVAAIIITVMLLEIRFPSTEQRYISFAWSVLVFIVSFFVVADFWYENKRVFEIVQAVDHAVMILNLAFLASLALIPVMTKWIMQKTIGLAVLNYGIIYLLTTLLHNALYFVALRKKFLDEKGLFLKLIFFRISSVLVPNIMLMILGWSLPVPAMVLYLALPIWNFLQPSI